MINRCGNQIWEGSSLNNGEFPNYILPGEYHEKTMISLYHSSSILSNVYIYIYFFILSFLFMISVTGIFVRSIIYLSCFFFLLCFLFMVSMHIFYSLCEKCMIVNKIHHVYHLVLQCTIISVLFSLVIY